MSYIFQVLYLSSSYHFNRVTVSTETRAIQSAQVAGKFMWEPTESKPYISLFLKRNQAISNICVSNCITKRIWQDIRTRRYSVNIGSACPRTVEHFSEGTVSGSRLYSRFLGDMIGVLFVIILGQYFLFDICMINQNRGCRIVGRYKTLNTPYVNLTDKAPLWGYISVLWSTGPHNNP